MRRPRLGATPWRAFLTVTLPLCVPGIAAGSVLCFSRSLGEFGATMAFVGNIPGETRTLAACDLQLHARAGR